MNKYIEYWNNKIKVKDFKVNIKNLYNIRSDKEQIKDLCDLIKTMKCKYILDYGSGTGVVAREILKSFEGCYTPCDINENLAKIFYNNIGIQPKIISDTLPFNDKTFDMVFTISVLMHIEGKDLKKVVSELMRVSKEFICIIEYTGNKTKLAEFNFKHNYIELFGEPTISIDYNKRTLYLFKV
jgi:ubiquinone/menaquinone biosynthesis C-methylase UbiE